MRVLWVLLGQLLVLWGPAAAQQRPVNPGSSARSHVIVLAHRGCWGKAPELSVSAIEACKALGADAVEIDVRESRDGVLVLMHDDSVDRTTDGTGLVSALSAAQIRALRSRAGAGGPAAALTTEHVPTLEEALVSARGKLLVNLHLKVPVEAKVAATVKRMNMTHQVTTWVTAKADDPRLLHSPLIGAVGLIPIVSQCGQHPGPCWSATIESLEAFSSIQPVAFFLDFRQSREFIESVSRARRPAGARIFAETLNTIDALPADQRHTQWQALLNAGVSVIMTDEPGDLIEFLQTAGYPVESSDASPLLMPLTASAPTKPLVIAHRGGAALLPENTFPAFDNAVRLGVDLLEFDMQMTADNHLIISHDGTVNPSFCTADPASSVTPGPIRAMTLAAVLKFDCGSKHRAIYPTQKAVPGTPMPIPDAFFARYKDTGALFFGETKMPGPGEGEVDPLVFTRLVAQAVHRYGLDNRFILQSSDYRTIDAMHAINPRIRTCLLSPWRAQMDYLKLALQHHSMCMLLRLQDADAAEVKHLRAAGVLVISDVVDDEAAWRDYLARGVDALFTNDPARLLMFLDRARP